MPNIFSRRATPVPTIACGKNRCSNVLPLPSPFPLDPTTLRCADCKIRRAAKKERVRAERAEGKMARRRRIEKKKRQSEGVTYYCSDDGYTDGPSKTRGRGGDACQHNGQDHTQGHDWGRSDYQDYLARSQRHATRRQSSSYSREQENSSPSKRSDSIYSIYSISPLLNRSDDEREEADLYSLSRDRRLESDRLPLEDRFPHEATRYQRLRSGSWGFT